MSIPLKVIFAGTPVFAAYHLEVLLQSEHQVIGVLTQPSRPSGRGNKLIPSPVKIIAQKNNIPVFEPYSLKQLKEQHIINCLNSDIMVVVAYGIILPKKVLDMPRLGCVNVHGSLLPRWRGAAPIQRSLCAGDTETGVSIIQMDVGIDTGHILYKIPCQITNTDTTDSLYYKLSHLGAQGLLITLNQLANGKAHPEVQDESLATYAKKLNKKEARLDWSLPAVQLERYIRAFNPWPVSYFLIRDQIVKVWQATVLSYHDQCQIQPGTIIRADKHGIQITTTMDILNLLSLQPADKKAMSVQDLLNSRRSWFTIGTVLS